MFKRKITLFSILVILVGLFVAVFFAEFKGETQAQQNPDKKEVKVRQIQKEKEKLFDPTPIQEGVMMAKQKKHSKIFKGYKNRLKIRDLVAQQGDIEVTEMLGDVIAPSSINLDTYLTDLSCGADVVVQGTVKSKASQINEDGTFLFTDYEFTVEDIIKNNPGSPIKPNDDITVTRTGGAVRLNGHTARAIDDRQMPLVAGESYLLFLEFIPETGAYSSLDSSRDDDSFQILGNQVVKQVSKNPLPFYGSGSVEANSFINKARAAVNTPCPAQKGLK